jgi:DNA-binding NarL/FixJ family response regulator
VDNIRVIVVDDHPGFRVGLARLLEDADNIEVVGTAADGEEAVRVAAEQQPDVVLMDLKMPGMNGIDATRKIVDDSPSSVRVLVLTMVEDDDSVFAAIRAGAQGYLVKGTEIDRIIDTVAFVADGGSVFSPGIAARAKGYLLSVAEHWASDAPEPGEGSGRAAAVTDPGPPVMSARGTLGGAAAFPQLTARELELLDLIADGHDNVEMARTLTLSEKTVRNHVSNILAKVQLANRYRLIVDARDAGFGSGQPAPPG